MSDQKFRWGLSNPSGIAVEFTKSIRSTTTAEIVAVGSRDLGRARAFANAHSIPSAFGSLEALAASPEVDAVYICSPVHAHAAAVEVIAAAGKAILVEKPFATSAAEAEAMFVSAKRHNVFLMEAMWTRFLPVWRQVRRLVDDGRIGEVSAIQASLGFPILGGARDEALLDTAKGGGSLLEVGVYPAQLLQTYLGEPDTVASTVVKSDSGADVSAVAALTFGDNVAAIQTSMSQWLPNSASISGTYGSIHVPPFFHAAHRFEIRTLTTEDPFFSFELVETETELGQLAHQAVHVAERVANGQIESDVMSPADTVATLRIIEAIRNAAT